MNVDELYYPLSALGALIARCRVDNNQSQTDVAEALDIGQSDVSQAENHPSRRPSTVLRIAQSICGIEFDETPRYRITKHPTRDLDTPTFDALAYHLRVLFYVDWWSSQEALLSDLERQFYAPTPGTTRMLETDGLRCAAGDLSEGAVRALEDLLTDGLIELVAVDVSPPDTPRTELRQAFRDLGFTDRQVEAAVERFGTSGGQPEGTWYLDDSGTKNDISGWILTVLFGLTAAGERLCGMLSSVRGRIGGESS